MSLFDLATVVLLAATLCYYVVRRYTNVPLVIGLVIASMAASIGVKVFDVLVPGIGMEAAVEGVLARVDFTSFVLEGVLCYLIFASAMEIDLPTLRARWKSIIVLATVGVAISTALFGLALPLVASVPVTVALLLGAMQAATDPVSVNALLKTMPFVPSTLKVKIAGESLLNDGVAVVVFLVLLALAVPTPGQPPMDAAGAAVLFAQEAVGGLLVGAAAAALAFYLLKTVSDPNLEILISLAAVMASYAVSLRLHVSGPLAMVVLGVAVGNPGLRYAVSDEGKHQVRHFWELVDVLLNAVLFTLIGMLVLVVHMDAKHAMFAAAAVALSLVARFVSVLVPLAAVGWMSAEKHARGSVAALTWGGVRGGILAALALSLPDSLPEKSLLLAGAYGIVVFSVIVQGLSFGWLVRKVVKPRDVDPAPAPAYSGH